MHILPTKKELYTVQRTQPESHSKIIRPFEEYRPTDFYMNSDSKNGRTIGAQTDASRGPPVASCNRNIGVSASSTFFTLSGL